MLNFTIGPVMSSGRINRIGAEQVPYFRTDEFSSLMLENEQYMLRFAKAPQNSRAIFMTCSSTGSMEAVVVNCLSKNDNVLIIDGGSFGHRCVELCDLYEIPHTVISLEFGKTITKDVLYKYDNMGFTAMLVNIDETSSGVLYDPIMLGEFCKKNNMFFICDCVSAFLAESFDMSKVSANIMITGSQKALACPPGVSIIVADPFGVERINNSKAKAMYLNLKEALKNQDRGQTPFTPAVGILIQINERLKEIEENGGANSETTRIASQAIDFRNKIKNLPFEYVSDNMPNGVTSLKPLFCSAHELFLELKDNYNIWVCPNGGDVKDTVFRVGHIGALSHDDNTTLVNALKDIINRGVLNK